MLTVLIHFLSNKIQDLINIWTVRYKSASTRMYSFFSVEALEVLLYPCYDKRETRGLTAVPLPGFPFPCIHLNLLWRKLISTSFLPFLLLLTSGSCVMIYFSGGLLRADCTHPGLTTHAQRRPKDCYSWTPQSAHYDCENKTPFSEEFNRGMAKQSEAFAHCCQQVKSVS